MIHQQDVKEEDTSSTGTNTTMVISVLQNSMSYDSMGYL